MISMGLFEVEIISIQYSLKHFIELSLHGICFHASGQGVLGVYRYGLTGWPP